MNIYIYIFDLRLGYVIYVQFRFAQKLYIHIYIFDIFILIYIIFILYIYKINARIGIENVIDEWKAVRSEVETQSKRDVISGLLARWKHQQLEGNQRSAQTPRVDLFSSSLSSLSSSSNAVFRYLCASSSFALPVHCHIAFHECESFERT